MDRKFNLDDFKKWMSEQKPEPKVSRLIGLQVESKLKAPDRLAKHVTSYEGSLEEITTEFCEDGGTILEVKDLSFMIEVNSGTFNIHRCFVRKKEVNDSSSES